MVAGMVVTTLVLIIINGFLQHQELQILVVVEAEVGGVVALPMVARVSLF